jgi:hypothetical protein
MKFEKAEEDSPRHIRLEQIRRQLRNVRAGVHKSSRRCRHSPLLAALLRINPTSSLRFVTDPNPIRLFIRTKLPCFENVFRTSVVLIARETILVLSFNLL